MVLQSKTNSDKASAPGWFTYKEILQQPDLWPTTVAIVRKSGWVNDKPKRPVIISGAGTSAYAATAIAASWPNARAIPSTELLIQSRDEIDGSSPGFSSTGLLISIGRSGDSPESVAVVKRIQQACPEVDHLAITCNADGQLAKTPGVQAIVLDPRTNDRSLAMTSSFSNLILAGLCLCSGEQLDTLVPSLCSDLRRHLPNLEEQAKHLSEAASQRVVILASGALTALATETSLKILELTAGRTVTLAETFLGLRHGPMSFVTPDTLVLCFLSSSAHRRRYEEALVSELRQKRLGRIVGIAPESANRDLFDEWVAASAGEIRDEWRVPFEIPFAQLLAYHLSLRAGLDPDNPSPMGAITRVVQQFAIHDESPGV